MYLIDNFDHILIITIIVCTALRCNISEKRQYLIDFVLSVLVQVGPELYKHQLTKLTAISRILKIIPSVVAVITAIIILLYHEWWGVLLLIPTYFVTFFFTMHIYAWLTAGKPLEKHGKATPLTILIMLILYALISSIPSFL